MTVTLDLQWGWLRCDIIRRFWILPNKVAVVPCVRSCLNSCSVCWPTKVRYRRYINCPTCTYDRSHKTCRPSFVQWLVTLSGTPYNYTLSRSLYLVLIGSRYLWIPSAIVRPFRAFCLLLLAVARWHEIVARYRTKNKTWHVRGFTVDLLIPSNADEFLVAETAFRNRAHRSRASDCNDRRSVVHVVWYLTNVVL